MAITKDGGFSSTKFLVSLAVILGALATLHATIVMPAILHEAGLEADHKVEVAGRRTPQPPRDRESRLNKRLDALK